MRQYPALSLNAHFNVCITRSTFLFFHARFSQWHSFYRFCFQQNVKTMTASTSKDFPEESKGPSVNIGNASNPSPNDERSTPSGENQLLGPEAEKYLREVASIEDEPDANDQKEMDETLRQNQQP